MHKISNIVTDLKSDLKDRMLSGYASVFGVEDLSGEVMLPGAFTDSIRERFTLHVQNGEPPRIHFLFQHDHGKPVGTLLSLREDQKGLFFTARVARTQLGDELLELVYSGAINGVSIGFKVIADERERSARRARLLRKVDLYEISAVTFPANEACRLKSLVMTGPDPLHRCSEPVGSLQEHASYILQAMERPGVTEQQRDLAVKALREQAILQAILLQGGR